jgi:hypothetical protein
VENSPIPHAYIAKKGVDAKRKDTQINLYIKNKGNPCVSVSPHDY